MINSFFFGGGGFSNTYKMSQEHEVLLNLQRKYSLASTNHYFTFSFSQSHGKYCISYLMTAISRPGTGKTRPRKGIRFNTSDFKSDCVGTSIRKGGHTVSAAAHFQLLHTLKDTKLYFRTYIYKQLLQFRWMLFKSQWDKRRVCGQMQLKLYLSLGRNLRLLQHHNQHELNI